MNKRLNFSESQVLNDNKNKVFNKKGVMMLNTVSGTGKSLHTDSCYCDYHYHCDFHTFYSNYQS